METSSPLQSSQLQLNPSKLTPQPEHDIIQYIPQNKTNSVLIMNLQNSECYYLPVYFRIIVHQFKQLELDSHLANIEITMIITVKYDGIEGLLKNRLVQHILMEGLDITPYLGDTIHIKSCLSNDEDIGQITLYHTQQCKCKIFPDLFWSPFQLLYAYTYFQFSSFQVSLQYQQIKFRINLMDHKNKNQKIRPGPNVWVKDYDLAQNLLQIQYSNKPFDQITMSKQFDFNRSVRNLSMKRNKGYELIDDQEEECQDKLRKNSSDNCWDSKKTQYIEEENQKKQQKEKRFMQRQKQSQQEKQEKNCGQRKSQKNEFQASILRIIGQLDTQSPQKNSKSLSFFNSTLFLDKPNNFRYANICIGIYKIPNSAFFNIFLPFLCLGIINLGIFFQDNSLADRIGAIATVMMAYVASLPTIRAELPRLPKNYMFIEYLISIQIFTTMLCLIQSLVIREEEQNFAPSWDNIWFQVTAILTGFNIACIVILYILHFCYWIRIYGDYSPKFKDNVNEFDSNQWSNEKCEQTFSNQIDFKKTVPIKPKGKQIIKLFNKTNCLSPNFKKFHPNLLQLERNGKKTIVQSSITINQQKYLNWQKVIQNKIVWNKKYLFLPKDVETRNGWCFSGSIVVDLYYSYFPILLYDVIEARKNILNYFQQSELWYLMYSLITQTVQFYQNGLPQIGNIRPQNILLNRYGHINISCRLSTLSRKKTDISYYYSPQFFEADTKKRKDRKQMIKYQAFAIGLTCLDAAILQFSRRLYDKNGKQIDMQLLQKAREQFQQSQRYSNLLTSFILGLCHPNPQQRLQCQFVYQLAKRYKNQIERRQI